MDFELKSLSPIQAASQVCDALLVLVPDASPDKRATGALPELVASVIRQGDLDSGVGKQLSCYRPVGFKGARR